MKADFPLRDGLLNAAGTLGFWPTGRVLASIPPLAAFVTDPISQSPRQPASGIRYDTYPGGFLLHTGYPNPGFDSVLRRSRLRWARSPFPVIVHLLAEDSQAIHTMVARLEDVEGVMGVEVGLPESIDEGSVADFAQAAIGELPIIVRLPFERASHLAAVAIAAGATAVSFAPPRGSLPQATGLAEGRLYGPAVFPQALSLVSKLTAKGYAIIASGGIYNQEQADTMLAAGALAVQLDAVLWGLLAQENFLPAV